MSTATTNPESTATDQSAQSEPINGELMINPNPQPQNTTLDRMFEAINQVRTFTVHNFGGDSWASAALASAAKSAAAQSMKDMPAEGVEIQYYFIHNTQVNKRNAEGYNPAIRTVLFGHDKTIWASSSEQVARDVAAIAEMVQGGEIPRGIWVKHEVAKAGANNVHKLVIEDKR